MPTLTSDLFVEVENKNVTGDAQANTLQKKKSLCQLKYTDLSCRLGQAGERHNAKCSIKSKTFYYVVRVASPIVRSMVYF